MLLFVVCWSLGKTPIHMKELKLSDDYSLAATAVFVCRWADISGSP